MSLMIFDKTHSDRELVSKYLRKQAEIERQSSQHYIPPSESLKPSWNP
jgi:hypothetical protein